MKNKFRIAQLVLSFLTVILLISLIFVNASRAEFVLSYDEYDSRADRQVLADDYERAIIDSTDNEGGFSENMEEYNYDAEFDNYHNDDRIEDPNYRESDYQDEYFEDMYDVKVE
jgi:hypothetical protein